MTRHDTTRHDKTTTRQDNQTGRQAGDGIPLPELHLAPLPPTRGHRPLGLGVRVRVNVRVSGLVRVELGFGLRLGLGFCKHQEQTDAFCKHQAQGGSGAQRVSPFDRGKQMDRDETVAGLYLHVIFVITWG